MEQNIDNKIELKNRLITFFIKNKIKIYFLFSFLIIIFILIGYLKISENHKNSLIAEKYIQAGVYLASDKKALSKNIYDEIILSENKFYSILSLNTIIENNLEKDKSKILNYFNILEKINKTQEQQDLIIFKKALFLIKSKDVPEGNKLLKKLIAENSKLKILAKEVITKK